MLKKFLNRLFDSDLVTERLNSAINSNDETAFTVSKKDQSRVSKWYKNHKCADKIKRYVVYEFVHTGIGTSVDARCSSCNSKLDLTDFDKW